MKYLVIINLLFLFNTSCRYEKKTKADIPNENIEHTNNWLDKSNKDTHCGYNDWRDFPLIIGVQYDKIILSGVSLNKEVSLQNFPLGKPDSITFYDKQVYDNMSDYQKWHYGESMLLIHKNTIEEFSIFENNLVLNQPMYAEIGKTKCNDFADYIHCECESILDKNGNGTIVINIIAPDILIVTDAHLYFTFEKHYLKRFGLNSGIF